MNARTFVLIFLLMVGSLLAVSAAMDRAEHRFFRISEGVAAAVCYALAVAAWIGWGGII